MNTINQDMVSVPFLKPRKTGTGVVRASPDRKLPLTVLQDDRIDDLATLHAAPGHEIEMTGVIHEIETLLDDHETFAPPASSCAGELPQPYRVFHFQVFRWKSDCRGHRRPPFFNGP
jgi:hypothetical protein